MRDRLPGLIPYAGVFAHGLGQAMVFATLAPLGREIGMPEVYIGLIISASSLVFFIASRIWGRISDRVGRKPVILAGLLGYTVGSLVFALLFGLGLYGALGGSLLFGMIIATRMLQSVVMSATAPATAAHVADITTSTTRTTGMARIGAANNIGSITGPALAGLLAGISLLLPLVCAALGTAVAAWLVQRHLRPVVLPAHGAHPGDNLRLFDPRVLPFLLLGLAIFTAFAVAQQTLAFRIQDTLQLDAKLTARTFGYAMIVSAITSLIAQVVLVQWLGLGSMTLLRSGMPLLFVAFASLIWTSTLPGFCIAMGLLGFGMGMCGAGYSAATSLAVSAGEQGAVAGISTAVPALGFIIGPVSGAALYQLYPVAPYALTAVMLIPAIVYAFRVRQHLHPD